MCCASQQNTTTQNLISALNGEGYFYGIGVTRETNNYRSLYNGETYIVMFVLILPVTFLKDEISSHIQPFFQDNDGPLN